MRILITGGLGFIGVNSALEFYNSGYEIHILDNLSRKGNIDNYLLLKKKIKFNFFNKDIRNFFDIDLIFKENKFDVVLHLAAQVAVTFSVRNPREDFEINATGTFNILECLRNYSKETILLYSSTNKVYGNYESEILEREKRYEYNKHNFSISENQNLDFHSPYGCSKGIADQYVRDYHRIYGLKTVVLRQSCIYGPNQFGIEDQGWVSWFSIASIFDKKFTIYGDGKQVRDVLHVYDLIELYKKCITDIEKCNGEIFNVGGGIENSLSLLELIDIIENKLNKVINFSIDDWRPGDQKIYISDISKIKKHIGWEPSLKKEVGVEMMIDWIQINKNVFSNLGLI
jgi:CDP-paratose 2-epimerase